MFETQSEREKRDVFLGLKVTQDERRVLDGVVRKTGLTLSDITRKALAEFLAKTETEKQEVHYE